MILRKMNCLLHYLDLGPLLVNNSILLVNRKLTINWSEISCVGILNF